MLPSKAKSTDIDIVNKPVALLQHGILDTGVLWVINGKESLGMKLVNAGFDVWINNTRGNRYSTEHQFLDIDNESDVEYIKQQRQRYYEFSFHEMGMYD